MKNIFTFIFILGIIDFRGEMVQKDDVVTGYLIINKEFFGNFFEFLPSKIKNNLSLRENLKRYRYGTGFYVYIGKNFFRDEYTQIRIKHYSFTGVSECFYIVPCELNLSRKRNLCKRSLETVRYFVLLGEREKFYYRIRLDTVECVGFQLIPLIVN